MNTCLLIGIGAILLYGLTAIYLYLGFKKKRSL